MTVYFESIDSDLDFFVTTEIPSGKVPSMMRKLQKNTVFQSLFDPKFLIAGKQMKLSRALHKSTARMCDFRFGSELDKHCIINTEIIRWLSVYDDRIKPLTLLLKHWFRINGLAGTGKFSSHCVFLMIVYFLQVSHKQHLIYISILTVTGAV